MQILYFCWLQQHNVDAMSISMEWSGATFYNCQLCPKIVDCHWMHTLGVFNKIYITSYEIMLYRKIIKLWLFKFPYIILPKILEFPVMWVIIFNLEKQRECFYFDFSSAVYFNTNLKMQYVELSGLWWNRLGRNGV